MVKNKNSPSGELELPRTRRLKGARYNTSLRIQLLLGEREVTAWALNISRGGLRAVFDEEHVDVGDELSLLIGDNPTPRPGRIVWTQQEPDGTIAGIEFLEIIADSVLLAWNGGSPATEPPPSSGVQPPSTVDSSLPLPDFEVTRDSLPGPDDLTPEKTGSSGSST